jgi:hypothetical protein
MSFARVAHGMLRNFSAERVKPSMYSVTMYTEPHHNGPSAYQIAEIRSAYHNYGCIVKFRVYKGRGRVYRAKVEDGVDIGQQKVLKIR